DGARYAADEQAVDQYLGTLEFATWERRVSEATDRKALGLGSGAEGAPRGARPVAPDVGPDVPRIAVAIAMGPRRERLIIGGGAPTPPGASYAEVDGRGVFVITKQLVAALDVSPERFRTRTFVPYVSTELSGLSLDGEGGPRHLTRASWGGGRGSGFRFDGSTPEGSIRARAEAVDRILSALGQMQAEAFLPDDQADRALVRRVTLTLSPRDPAAKRGLIELGGPCPAGDPAGAERVVAIRREPTRASACVPASVLDALTAPAADLVDLSPVGAPLDEIAEVKLAEGDRKLELARADAEWHMRAPEDRRVPAETGRALAQALLDVEATRVAPTDRAEGLDPPRATLRIVSTPSGREGAPAERVEAREIGAQEGDVVHVRRLEDGAVLEVPAAAASALLPGDLSLRKAAVFDFESERVRELRVRAGPVSQRLRRTAGNAWELLTPAGEGLRADLGLASDLAEVLAGLQAARWVAADAGDGYGLGAPRLVIEADIAGEGDKADSARTARVELGAPTGNGSFARAGGSASPGPAVFVAPPTLEAAAGRLLLDRSVFLVPPDRVARIQLEPDRGPPAVIQASPGGWTLTPAKPGAASLAAGVRDALSGLMAEGAVSLGKPDRRQGFDPPRLRVTIELTPAQGAKAPPIRIAIGAGDAFRGINAVYARRDGVAATYALAQARVQPLLDAAGVR
ncbi:MAG: DUF4340 domain-containing protein, partial [Polyangiaceae bacterium]|nr:DUF4340 domain-containing protein [Polyangiaceae bacterium]